MKIFVINYIYKSPLPLFYKEGLVPGVPEGKIAPFVKGAALDAGGFFVDIRRNEL